MSKLAELIAKGEIPAEELLEADVLIKRAEFVKNALEACKKTIKFSLGEQKVSCYEYCDFSGDYSSWGECTLDGFLIFYTNHEGEHEIGRCNLNSFEDVFNAISNSAISFDLCRFLQEQIAKVQKM